MTKDEEDILKKAFRDGRYTLSFDTKTGISDLYRQFADGTTFDIKKGYDCIKGLVLKSFATYHYSTIFHHIVPDYIELTPAGRIIASSLSR